MSQQPADRPKPDSHLPLNHFNDKSAEAAYAEAEQDVQASMSGDTPSTAEATTNLHDPPKSPGPSSPSSTPSETATSLPVAIQQLRTIRDRLRATRVSWEFAAHTLEEMGCVGGDRDIVTAMH